MDILVQFLGNFKKKSLGISRNISAKFLEKFQRKNHVNFQIKLLGKFTKKIIRNFQKKFLKILRIKFEGSFGKVPGNFQKIFVRNSRKNSCGTSREISGALQE